MSEAWRGFETRLLSVEVGVHDVKEMRQINRNLIEYRSRAPQRQMAVQLE
jgi:hypothetical protein